VRVALPRGADPGGLTPESGRVIFSGGSDSSVVYDLFRSVDPGTLKLKGQRDLSKLGEDSDVLEQRSKWFQAREGRSE
jgi:hypothetical protein